MAGAFRGQLALGTKLSGENAGARVTLGLAALIALGFAVFAVRVARRDGATSLADAVALSSTALAWGAGLLFLVGAATQGLARDRVSGVSALYRLHGVSRGRYLLARTIGLGLHLLRVVALGSLLVAVAGAAAAPRLPQIVAAARGWAACLVYAFAFALVVAPLAAAAGGAPLPAAAGVERLGTTTRSPVRGRGFLVLVVVLLLPALVKITTVGVLGADWRAVLGIPSALSAVRALVLGGDDVGRAVRAGVVLVVIAALGALVSRAEIGGRRRAAEDGAW